MRKPKRRPSGFIIHFWLWFALPILLVGCEHEYVRTVESQDYHFDGSLPLAQIQVATGLERPDGTQYQPALTPSEYYELAQRVLTTAGDKWKSAKLVEVVVRNRCWPGEPSHYAEFVWSIPKSKPSPFIAGRLRQEVAVGIDALSGRIWRVVSERGNYQREYDYAKVIEPSQAGKVIDVAIASLSGQADRSHLLSEPGCQIEATLSILHPSVAYVALASDIITKSEYISIDISSLR